MDEMSQGSQESAPVVNPPTESGVATDGSGDTATETATPSNPELSSLEQEIATLKERIQKDGSGYSRKINEQQAANSQLENELSSRDTEIQQLRAELNSLRQNYSRNDNYDDDNGGDNSMKEFQDSLARQALLEMNQKFESLQSEYQKAQRMSTQKAQIMKDFGIDENAADEVLSAYESGDFNMGARMAHLKAEEARIRREEKLRSKREAPPPVTGASTSSVSATHDSDNQSDMNVDDFLKGDYTSNQRANMLAENPGLMDKLLKSRKR